MRQSTSFALAILGVTKKKIHPAPTMTMMSLLCRRLWTSFLLLVVGTSSYHLASSFVLDSPAGVQSHRALTEFKAHNTDNNESSSFFLSSSEVSTRMMTAKSFFAGILTAGMLMFSAPNLPAAHAESRLIGEVKGSGLVFKVSSGAILMCARRMMAPGPSFKMESHHR